MLGLLAGALPAFPATDRISSMSFTMTLKVTPPRASKGQQQMPAMPPQRMNVLIKGKKVNMDLPMGMGKVIGNGKQTYNYFPARKVAQPTGAGAAAQAMGPLGVVPGATGSVSVAAMKANVAKQLKGAKRIGSAQVNGHKSAIYSLARVPGSDVKLKPGQSVKVWLAQDLLAPFPVRMTVTDPQGANLDINFLGIRVNPNLPDSLFELPKGTKIETARAMPMPPGAMRPPRR